MWGEIAGSVVGGVLGGIGQNQANISNAREAAKNREFQMMMSNTAHTREVADLRNAGLNPILSAGGGGASTPSGAVPTIESTLEPASASARGLAQALRDARMANEQIASVRAQRQLTEAQTASVKNEIARKSLGGGIGSDASRVYQVFHDRIAEWLQHRGINQSNAKDVNWFFGDLDGHRPGSRVLKTEPFKGGK